PNCLSTERWVSLYGQVWQATPLLLCAAILRMPLYLLPVMLTQPFRLSTSWTLSTHRGLNLSPGSKEPQSWMPWLKICWQRWVRHHEQYFIDWGYWIRWWCCVESSCCGGSENHCCGT